MTIKVFNIINNIYHIEKITLHYYKIFSQIKIQQIQKTKFLYK